MEIPNDFYNSILWKKIQSHIWCHTKPPHIWVAHICRKSIYDWHICMSCMAPYMTFLQGWVQVLRFFIKYSFIFARCRWKLFYWRYFDEKLIVKLIQFAINLEDSIGIIRFITIINSAFSWYEQHLLKRQKVKLSNILRYFLSSDKVHILPITKGTTVRKLSWITHGS